jgi:S-adenosyl-L-methionine hydrolase (adenosine-forming)
VARVFLDSRFPRPWASSRSILGLVSGPRPICFLSDYGLGDDFVGLCKGVMLRIAPGAPIVDLTHEVPGFGVMAGAEILEHATRYMPEDTIYLAVVDPGVGTERRALALSSADGALLVGPDNGLLLPATESLGGITSAVSLTNAHYHVQPVASTFHGRDIFAPAAAHLASGLDLEHLGEAVEPTSLVRVEPFAMEKEGANTLVATIIAVDRYGNARFSVKEEEAGLEFGMSLELEAGEGGGMLVRYVETFGHSKVGDLVLVPDSHRRLSLSVNQGNASRALALEAGDRVRLSPLENGPDRDEERRDAGA